MEGLTAGGGFSGGAGDNGRRADTRPADEADRNGGNGSRATGPEANREPPGPLVIVRRELIILAIALVVGFVLVPLAIWAVGNRILGPYTHLQDPTAGTGPARLLADFYDGLGHGSVVFWWVGLGPYVLLGTIRLLYRLIRPASATSASRG